MSNGPARIGWMVAGIVMLVCLAARGPLHAADVPELKVCLVSGSIEYKSNDSLALLQTYLEAHYRAQCTRAFIENNDLEHLPGLEHLDHCDVMLLFTRRLKITGDDLERVKKYCLSGKPIVGVRTASHAFQNWLELDKEVFGGNYGNHYGKGDETEIEVVESARQHPILEGFTPFRSAGTLYRNKGIAADTQLLLNGSIPDHTEPIAWTRTYKGARIFYTSLGHPQDFNEPSFRKMLIHALFWTAGRAPAAR